jgi:hypothetical protein
MKRTLLVLLVAFTAVTFGQSVMPLFENGTVRSTRRLMTSEEFLKNEKYKTDNLEKMFPNHLQKVAKKVKSWGFTVGSKHKWFTLNRTTGNYEILSSTCRSVGTNSYIFVEDSLWGSKVTQAAVDSVNRAFNTATPNTPSEGIFQLETEKFGSVPDIDGDPKIIIFILDIRDGATASSGSYVAGYFHSLNEYTNADLKDLGYLPTSNECEMYYCDANPGDLLTASGIKNAMGTAAHEFQHMIHYYYSNLYNRTQETFINESMSQVAPYICGYPLDAASSYFNDSNEGLFTWRSSSDLVLNDYARAQRFSMYIWDRCGEGVIKNIIQSPKAGLAGVKDAFSKASPAIDLSTFLQNWFMADIVGDTTINTAYGYKTSGLAYASPSPSYNPNATNSKDTIQSMSVQYLGYELGKNLKINFSSASDKVKVKAIKYGTSSYVIEDVPINTDYAVPDYGTTYPTLQFAVMNVDTANACPIVINSSGTPPANIEMVHSTAEPTGVLSLVVGDTILVGFDGVSGSQIDSIRVAVRRGGSTIVPINAFLGQINDTYTSWLGTGTNPFTKILSSFQLVSPLSSTPTTYPAQWANWATVKFSPALDGSKAFGVAAIINTLYSDATAQNIMVNDSSTGFNYSCVKEKASTTATTRTWYYITTESGTSYNFLMRAYLSFGSTGVKQVVELLPKQFNVQQNYPNPFNPSTTISYSIPKDGNVKITVYNTLGKEVGVLVDEFQKSGAHSVRFSNPNLASGVYFYRVEAGDNVKTLRMLLLK